MIFLNIDQALEYTGTASEQNIGGEIDYDPEFIELENLLTSTPEQQYGNTIIPAAEPDWAKALPLALMLLGKSLDFRVAVIITRALTHRDGIAGTLKGVRLVHNLAQWHWDTSYPSLEFDGDYDPLLRSNAIAPLGSTHGLLGDLRQTDITIGQIGKISLGKIDQIISGHDADTDQPLNRDQLTQALTENLANNHPELIQLNELRDEIKQLNVVLANELGPENTPDLTPIKRLLNQVIPELKTPASLDINEHEIHRNDNAAINQNPEQITTVRNRTDAIAMLDMVCEFLERNESANPAPHLIRRARNMIGQDFFTILKEIAPDGLSQAEHITGLKH